MSVNEIKALEKARREAMMRGDADALAALTDVEGWYCPGTGERQKASQWIDLIRQKTVEYLSVTLEGEDVVLFPGMAIVTGTLVMKVRVAGEEILNRRALVDVWVERPEGWRLGFYSGTMLSQGSQDEIQREIKAAVRRALIEAGVAV